LLFFGACTTTMPAATNAEDSYWMHVECLPSASIRQEVIVILKRGHAKDIRVETAGNNMTIDAAYYKEDNPIGLLEDIADELKNVGQVLTVELRDNPRTVRENR